MVEYIVLVTLLVIIYLLVIALYWNVEIKNTYKDFYERRRYQDDELVRKSAIQSKRTLRKMERMQNKKEES